LRGRWSATSLSFLPADVHALAGLATYPRETEGFGIAWDRPVAKGREREMQGAEQRQRQWGEKVRAMTDEELAAARQALAGVIESCRANPAQRKEYAELSEVLAREQERREASEPSDGHQT
jgi:hypothetical protein